MSTSGFSVSIPNSVRKTIQDIKEITVNQSEEEIYAMLKECSMDPNKTTQKLLLQETFPDIKRKRERRKKNLSNRQPGEVRWRSGTQGRGGRGGGVSLSPRFTSHDAGRGRGTGTGKENGLNQGAEKDVAPLQTSYESKNKERSSVTSSAPVIANRPANIACGSTSTVRASNILAGSGGPELSLSYAGKDISSSKLNPGDANKNPIAVGTEDSWDQPAPSPTSSLAVCFSSSDPVLEPFNDSQVPAAVGLKREVGSHCLPATEIGSSSAQGMMPNSFQEVGKCQLTELSQAFSISTHGGSSLSLPSSNYSSWSQQIICGQNDETFPEVKRKRERRKKNLSNKQPGEVRWRSGMQGRGGRGGNVSLSPRFASHDAGRGRGSGSGRENGLNQGAEKDVAPLQTNKESSSVTSSAPVIANGPTNIACGSTSTVHASNILAGSGGPEISLSNAGKDISSSKLNPGDANKNPIAVGAEDSWEQPAPSPTSSLAVCFSSSDPVLEPSNDSQVPAAVGLKREVGSHCLPGSGGPEISLSYAGKDISSSKLNPGDANKNPIAVGTEDSWEQPAPSPTSSLAVCFSSSDPVLEPSNDSQVPAAVGLKREVGSHCLPGSGGPEISLSYVGKDISSSKLNPGDANKNPIAVGTEDSWDQPAPSPTSSSAVCFSSSDPVLEPSNDSQVPAAVGLKREVGSHCLPGSSGPEISLPYVGKDISSSKLNPGDANKNPIAVGTEDSWEQPAPSPTSSLAVCFSSSDPVLEPSNDSQVPAAVGLKREVGSHCLPATEIDSSSAQGMMPNSFQGVGKCQLTEFSHSFSMSTYGGFSVSLPSSNCGSWSQQIICGQKDVGSDEEWKSKPTSSAVQGPGTAGASEIPTAAAAEATTLPQPEAKLQRKLEELHIPQHQHVILPNHIHVPESERTKLSFGSFGASSVVITGNASGEERDKCSTTVSETSQRIEDPMEEHSSRFVMYCILALGLVWIASFFA